MKELRKIWEENEIQCSLKIFQNYVHDYGLDEAINHFKYEYKPQVKRDKPLTIYWKESGLDCSYDYFKSYVRLHSDLAVEQVIEELKKPKEKTIKQIYNESGLQDICTYGAFKNFRRNHPELNDEQIIDFYKTEYKPVKQIKRDKSLKQVHAESGLICSYNVFKAYVAANKDKTLDEIIEYLKNNYIPRKEIVENSLYKVWRDNKLNCNVNYFIKYVKEHPEKDINSVIKKFKQDEEISLASVCKRENANIHSIRGYIKRYNITVDEALDMYRNKEREDKERSEFRVFCEENGINAYNAWIYKNKHPEITNEEILEHYKHESISSKCKRLNISYSAVMNYKKEHPELDYESIIDKYLQPKKLTFTEKCRAAGIHSGSATAYRGNHPELTDEEVIERFIVKKRHMKLCKKIEISYEIFMRYKRSHTELTDEEIVMHYNPNCYINGFGELVIL